MLYCESFVFRGLDGNPDAVRRKHGHDLLIALNMGIQEQRKSMMNLEARINERLRVALQNELLAIRAGIGEEELWQRVVQLKKVCRINSFILPWEASGKEQFQQCEPADCNNPCPVRAFSVNRCSFKNSSLFHPRFQHFPKLI